MKIILYFITIIILIGLAFFLFYYNNNCNYIRPSENYDLYGDLEGDLYNDLEADYNYLDYLYEDNLQTDLTQLYIENDPFNDDILLMDDFDPEELYGKKIEYML